MIVNAETGAHVDLEHGPGPSWWTPRATAAFLATRRPSRDDADDAADANAATATPSPSSYARLVQGECAALRGPAPPGGAALGSQDATTCAVVALWWPPVPTTPTTPHPQPQPPQAPLLWLAHLDAAPGEAEARRLARLMAERREQAEGPALYVVGAYEQVEEEEEEEGDEEKRQQRRKQPVVCVAAAALRFVARAAELAACSSNPPRLVLACVGAHNTSENDGAPLATALAVDLGSGAATCRVERGGASRLPRQAQRLAAALTGQRRGPKELVEVQVAVVEDQAAASRLEVRVPEPPRGWQMLWGRRGGRGDDGGSDEDEDDNGDDGDDNPESPLAGLRRELALSDRELLKRLSTSPRHEPPWFVEEMREHLAWVVAEVEAWGAFFFSSRGRAATDGVVAMRPAV